MQNSHVLHPAIQNERQYLYSLVDDKEENTSKMDKNEGKDNVTTNGDLDETSSDVLVTWSQPNSLWADWQLPVFVVLFASIGLLTITFIILLWVKNQLLSSKKSGGNIASTTSCTGHQQWISHPVLNPLCDSAGIQPCKYSTLPEVMTRQEISSEKPIRIKTKGLLERRGSSASLTIDLHHSQENLSTVITPTRECSTEEYLLSAGNVLSRGQLRSVLHDIQALHKEFWDVPPNSLDKAVVTGSGRKNRYRTVIPNEKTRVHLPTADADDELSGYINANYMRGYDAEDKAYIATQGPLHHTVVDFWLMVWSEHSPAIVMITNLWEQGKPKCEQYFPMGTGETDTKENNMGLYGDITVVVKHVVQRDGYAIRHLFLQRGDETARVCHFWFDSWPDHKVPADASSLLALASEVEGLRRNSCEDQPGPVVVHCSAGIGRSGCFIALCIGMNQLLRENNVDILGIVCQMRYDRGGMIQTAEQYEFIHQALSLFELSLPDQSGELTEVHLSQDGSN
ncbi:tyrosine-protein phosphatase non-receptor type 5-like [Bacillus rossius redtenbacheri]|uniref:tyrosine-protein phosphatase non-receptor type 5-like n=1 Tax=Bacillus rossius redtenbacheri TaxID=93214 RepID=UPI002FDDD4D3